MRSLSRGVAHVFLLKHVLDDVRLLLAPKEMTADGRHHLETRAGPTLPARIGFHVLMQQLVGIEFRAVAGQLDQADVVRVGGDEGRCHFQPMDGMSIDDEVHLAHTLQPQSPHAVDEHRCAECAVKDAKYEPPAIGDRRDHATAEALTSRAHDGGPADQGLTGAGHMIAAEPHLVAPL